MKDNLKQNVYALVGPTCTYKSSISIQLAKKYPFEIISADSRLIYKGMDIGTSKPSSEDRDKVPHHMIDVVEVVDDYSVGLYKQEVENKIKDIFARGRTPIFVGGTGLYLNSVLLGLSIPEVKADINLRRQFKEMSQDELYAKLKEIDVEAANTIHKNDNFRTARALEVIYKTNKLFSTLKKQLKVPFNVCWIGLAYKDRNLHTQKIQDRTESFCKNGFIDEVKSLLKQHGELDLFYKTIGYKEAVDFLKNRINKEEMINKITLSTRQFVKRQMTWFKANKKINWIYLDGVCCNSALDKVISFVEDWSLANTSSVSIS